MILYMIFLLLLFVAGSMLLQGGLTFIDNTRLTAKHPQRNHRYNNCTEIMLFNQTVNPGLCYTPPGIKLKDLRAG